MRRLLSATLAIAVLVIAVNQLLDRQPDHAMAPDRIAYLQAKAEKKQRAPKRYDKPAEAHAFYAAKRVIPGTQRLPVERYRVAREHQARMARFQTSASTALPAPPASEGDTLELWRSLGPGNVGGRTRALVIHPAQPDTLFAAGVAGGVWKSSDGGSSWQPLTDTLANMAITVLAMDPTDPDTIYAGSGEGFFNSDAVRGDGIFKSTDGGSTWSQLTATADNVHFHYVNDLVVSSNDTQRLYAATRTGVWRSIDGGNSWSRVYQHNANQLPAGCLDLEIRTDASPDGLLASCGSFNGGEIVRSADGGSSWASVLNNGSNAGAELDMGRISLAIAPSNQTTVYALAATHFNASGNYANGGLHAVFKSIDGGATWTATVRNSDGTKLNTVLLSNPVFAFLADCGFGGPNQFFNQGWYDNVIAVDPLDENIVWAGGIDLFRSDDGGQSWGLTNYWWTGSNSPNYLHADQHRLVFHPDYDGTTNQILFVGNDGGVTKTTAARGNSIVDLSGICGTAPAGAPTWTSLNNGYAVTQFYHGLPYPGGETFFGGTQDNGTQRGTLGSGSDGWTEIRGGDGGYVAVDPTNPNILFVENTDLSLQKSTNGGSTYTDATGGINTGGFLFITPYILDPNNPQRLWIGGSNLWRTDNQASSWSRASAALDGSLSAIAVAPGNSNRVLAGTTNGTIHYSHNALGTSPGTTWSGSKPVSGYVSSVAFDPANADIAYATYASFGVNHLWRSVDGGVTWSAIDQQGSPDGIPDIPAHSVVVDPANSDRLYVGTDLGLFVSDDGGTTWMTENSGFANTPVEHLAIESGFLYAFTHGRGAFRAQLGTISGSFDRQTPEDTELTFAASDFTGALPTVSGIAQVVIDDLPTIGTLSANGSALNPGATLALGDLDNLLYVPNADSNGNDLFRWHPLDGGNTTLGATGTTNLTISAVNDAPSFTLSASTISVAADNTTTQPVTVIPDTPPADEAAQTVQYALTPGSVSFATVAFNPSTGELSLTANNSGTGSQLFTITADDQQASNNTHAEELLLTVSAATTGGGTDTGSDTGTGGGGDTGGGDTGGDGTGGGDAGGNDTTSEFTSAGSGKSGGGTINLWSLLLLTTLLLAQRGGRRFAAVAACALALGACGAAPNRSELATELGTVRGTAMLYGTCGNVIQGGNCPPQPIDTPLTLRDGASAVVTTIKPAADGAFTLQLPAGTYSIVPARNPVLTANPVEINVHPGGQVEVQVRYRAGIR